MSLTPHQAKYLAYELTRRGPANSIEKFAGTLADAKVDMNPHQVEAALFAFKSPLSKGAILADEVGLGKTISWHRAFAILGRRQKPDSTSRSGFSTQAVAE